MSLVSQDSANIALKTAAFYYLKVFTCDIHNEYLNLKSLGNKLTVAGKKFGSDQGKFMLVIRALYGLKLSVEAFRGILAEQLRSLS